MTAATIIPEFELGNGRARILPLVTTDGTFKVVVEYRTVIEIRPSFWTQLEPTKALEKSVKTALLSAIRS